MKMLDEQDLAALALTSRLVDSAVKPLSAREFWALRRTIEPTTLHGMAANEIAAELVIPAENADRIAQLFDRIAGIAIALENLDHSGIWTITGVGQDYPKRLHARLRDAAPVVLHGVGDASLLDMDGVGVVGARDITAEASQVACEIALEAVKLGLPVVSGAARGVDGSAMDAALEAEGRVVGVLADSLERAVSRRATRRGVADGHICLITPYMPTSPFSVGNAMGRNKITYGLSRCTVVVVSDHQTGGTWAGATEALNNNYGHVASWSGPGGGSGNSALVDLGAAKLADVAQLDELLGESVAPPPLKADEAFGDQLTLDI
jgi:predicted Rossmann fold nucleotide-binding protein DprA/Smf involved in DNA uptake